VSLGSKALKHWKSTAGGFLTVSLTTSTAILTVPGVNTFIQPKHLTLLMIGQAVAKVWISLIQEDAGVVEAKVAGEPGTQMVPSHEIPNDPAAVPVIKEQ
jgi:hypothetical protein